MCMCLSFHFDEGLTCICETGITILEGGAALGAGPFAAAAAANADVPPERLRPDDEVDEAAGSRGARPLALRDMLYTKKMKNKSSTMSSGDDVRRVWRVC